MILIVDGYNMIGTWPELQNDDFDKARIDLIEQMADYAGFSGDEVTVVFDGHLSRRPLPTIEQHAGITVVYTKSGETADQYIERYVHSKTNNVPRITRPIVKVATSDAIEQSVVLSRGAIRVSAPELRRDVRASRRLMHKTIEQNTPVKTNMIGGRVDANTLQWLEELRNGGVKKNADRD